MENEGGCRLENEEGADWRMMQRRMKDGVQIGE